MNEPRTLATHPEMHSHQSFPVFRALGEGRKNALEKLLSVFADVRAGEGTVALLLTFNALLLLGASYLLKPLREALILAESGAVTKSYAAAGQALLLFAVVPLYGWIGTKVNRLALVGGATLFLASNLLLFSYFGSRGAREGVVFYIWFGIFNVFVVSQFWAFANDLYTEGQGRRLFPIIGVGASVGAWLGAVAVSRLLSARILGVYEIMLLAAALLAVAVGITGLVNRRQRLTAEPDLAREAEEPLSREGGFRLIAEDRYLFWIAVLTVLLNIVNSSGEFLLGKLVESEALRLVGSGDALGGERKQFIGSFYGSFMGGVNLLSLLLQLFVVSRIMRYWGVRGALFVLPCLALVGYSSLIAAPLLAVVRVAKTLENATDYSLQNTVKQALWLPTSRAAKYKAKAAVDTFFMRFGDVLQAAVVWAGISLGAGVRGFAALNVLLTAAWLWVAWQIKLHHRRRTL